MFIKSQHNGAVLNTDQISSIDLEATTIVFTMVNGRAVTWSYPTRTETDQVYYRVLGAIAAVEIRALE